MDKSAKVIDLFAGAGGLSLGAARAGFDMGLAVELDEHAMKCHETNFPSTNHLKISVDRLTGSDLKRHAKGHVRGIIGGPPCQGFSRIGKRRPDDERNSLFLHFFRLVRETQPDFFVAENVPGIMDDEFSTLRSRALNSLKGYHVIEPFRLLASDYGAATSRERVFFVGFRAQKKSLSKQLAELKSGELTTVEKALHGLDPSIEPNRQSETQSWSKVRSYKRSEFAERLRAAVPVGVGNTVALEKLRKQQLVSGFFGTNHSVEVVRRFSEVEQGKTDQISRAYRLKWDGLCPTLRAGTDKLHGSFQALRPIHPSESRMITPREAARLQGFPDWFVFAPTKWHSFRQIGNSVSPILSENLFTAIQRIL